MAFEMRGCVRARAARNAQTQSADVPRAASGWQMAELLARL